MTAMKTERPVVAETKKVGVSRLLLVAGIMAIVVGVGSAAGGTFGAWYTYDQAVAQNVVTPDDAVIPETPVRGPFTMWARPTSSPTISSRTPVACTTPKWSGTVPQLDENGEAVLDENGEAVMVPNEARASWLLRHHTTTAHRTRDHVLCPGSVCLHGRVDPDRGRVHIPENPQAGSAGLTPLPPGT